MIINYIFIITAIIIGFHMIRGSLRGIVLCTIDLFMISTSILFGTLLSPRLVGPLINSSGYTTVKVSLRGVINYNILVNSNTISDKTSFISSIKLPTSLSNYLLENNNPEIYKVLNVDSIGDYIINMLMTVIVKFTAIFICIAVIYIILYFIKLSVLPNFRLPTFGIIDYIVGCVFGFLKGVIFVWLLLTFCITVIGKIDFKSFNTLIESSMFLSYLYKNNLLIDLFLTGGTF